MENVLDEFLEDYNASTTNPVKLVLFQDAIDHICRINRILRQPRGNALLLGVGGSGGTGKIFHINTYRASGLFFPLTYRVNDKSLLLSSINGKAMLMNGRKCYVFQIFERTMGLRDVRIIFFRYKIR